jgi:hypothetical protein
MSTASSRTVAAPLPAALRPAARLLPAVATVVGVAVWLWLTYAPWFLNYDARYALLWAQDLWHGHVPDYTATYAPTPHPLQTAAGLVLVPLGAHADQALTWIVLLSFGALVWLVQRLGAALFSPWTGVVAALVVFSRPALQRDALLAYQDIPFAALVAGALLLEVRSQGRRPGAVLAVLALAGLVRPEAWLLSAAYLVWRCPRRPSMLALAATAPLIWAGTDLLVTGDALHSLHGTAALAEEADRRRELDGVPHWTAHYLGFVLREPVLFAVPLGLVFAWRHRRREAALPLAAAILLLAVFAAGPLLGLPLIGRYVRTPAILLALFYGLAVCGWQLLRPGRERTVWAVAGAAAALASVAYFPWHAGRLEGLDDRIARSSAEYADLERLARAPAVRRAVAACATLATADHRPVPYLRDWLDLPPGAVHIRGERPSRILVGPRGTPRPPGHVTVNGNRGWRAFAAPACVTRRPASPGRPR